MTENGEWAWKIGSSVLMLLQTCDSGYDYTLYDMELNLIDGGQIDNPDLSYNEARSTVQTAFGLSRVIHPIESKWLRDEVEKAFEGANNGQEENYQG